MSYKLHTLCGVDYTVQSISICIDYTVEANGWSLIIVTYVSYELDLRTLTLQDLWMKC